MVKKGLVVHVTANWKSLEIANLFLLLIDTRSHTDTHTQACIFNEHTLIYKPQRATSH